MLEEIKIIDENNIEIKPDKDNLVVVPVNNKNEFVSVEAAKDLIRVLQGQINIIEAHNVSKKRFGKHKENIDCKTGCSTWST